MRKSAPTIVPMAGSKQAIAPQVVATARSLGWSTDQRWIEPFVGGGHCTLAAIQAGCGRVWINDLDPATAAMWRAVRDDPAALIRAVAAEGVPSDQRVQRLRLIMDIGSDDLELATARIVVGGRNHGGVVRRSTGLRPEREYSVDARIEGILHVSRILREAEVEVTCMDATDIVSAAGEGFLFLDPPYWEAGARLYRAGVDHHRLANAVHHATIPWLMTMDDAPAVRDLYHWARIESASVASRLSGHRRQHELFILPVESSEGRAARHAPSAVCTMSGMIRQRMRATVSPWMMFVHRQRGGEEKINELRCRSTLLTNAQ